MAMSDTSALLLRLQSEQSLRWHAGERPLVESYLAAHPELGDDSAGLLDLLNHEVLLREEQGEAPRLDEYLVRFPHLEGALRDLFEVRALLEAEPPPADAPTLPGPTLPAATPDGRPPHGTPSVPGYDVLKELGRGGMGVVHLAWQAGLNRLVALKMIRAGASPSSAELARFRTEAEAAARLEHPNIVRVYEVGTHDACPYFSLEYVAGGSLAASLRGAPWPARPAADLLEVLARAMQYAHQRGVVHRDLTPNNVLLQAPGLQPGDFGTPKITDFGLARLLVGGSGHTQTGDIFGTPSYMAPEQASGRGKDAGPATDVYALGAILYELLTGRPPFRGETAYDTLLQVNAGDPVPPTHLQPTLPRDLETICLHCLRKEPTKRYASAQDLADDLRRFLDGTPIQARPVGLGERGLKWARRRPAAATLLALSALVLLGGIPLVSGQWYQTQRAWEAERRQREATDEALRREAEQRLQFQSLSARLVRDQGLRLCEQGDVGRGLLSLAHALEMAPDQDEDLRRALRTNLAAAVERIHPLRALLSNESNVLAVAWSRDGSIIATGGHDRQARLWDAVTGTCRHILEHDDSVRALALSADGHILLTATARHVNLWDTTTDQPIAAAGLAQEADVLALALSADGTRVLTGTRGGAVRLWDSATGELLRKLDGPTLAVRIVAFSPDGKRLLAAGDDSAGFLWSATGDLLGPLKHERSDRKIGDAAFSPDGKTVLTGSYDGTARLWDTATAQPHRVVDAETGAPLPVVLRHPGPISAVAFSPDSKRVVIAGADQSARVWTLTGQPRGQPLRHDGGVAAVAFSPDGKTLLSGGWDQAARLWDAATGDPLGSLLPHPSEVTRVTFLRDGRIGLTFSRDRAVRLWQMPARPAEPLRHEHRVAAVAFSPDGRLALTASSDRTVQLWDALTGRPHRDPLPHPHFVLAAAFAPDGRTIVTGCEDRRARLWDVATGKCLKEDFVHPDRVRAVAVSPDGKRLLTGCENGRVYLWDLATGESLPAGAAHHDRAVYAVAFSPDGNTFLTGSEDMTARLWDAATGGPRASPLVYLGTVRSVAYSRDGQILLTGSDDRTARLWRAATGEPFETPLVHPSSVLAVAFGAGDLLLATGCQDEAARLWDRASGHPIGLAFRHPRPVRAVAFRPDGQMVLTGCDDSKARFWPVPEPVTEEVSSLLLRVQVLVGLELDARGAARLLEAAEWLRRRQQSEP
jgi:WD40 repeat protein